MDVQAAYQEALRYLYDHLPMFSKLGKDAIKKDITNVRRLCTAVGDPQEKFKSVHIAGTNGKGSTSHMLAAVLQSCGYKVGLYTSPHLVDFRERIRINGVPVSKQWVVDFISRHQSLIDDVAPSFFEVTVAMAFQFFADEQVDIAVVETGLGGRLDSTNIITPILSLITNISYDHKDVLGSSLREIATEKAGIIKEKVPVLIGEQQEETANVFFETSVHRQSAIYYAQSLWDLVRVRTEGGNAHYKAIHKARREMHDLHTDVLGSYQVHNIKTVLAAAEILNERSGLRLPLEQVLDAFGRTKALTGLRGRWEQLSQQPLVIADVAHNPAGVQEVLAQWQAVDAARKHIVVGFVKDKDVAEALSLFPKEAIYHFCNAQIPRALPAADLAVIAQNLGLQGSVYATIANAVDYAKTSLSPDDALLITGSFFVVGEALQYLERHPSSVSETGN